MVNIFDRIQRIHINLVIGREVFTGDTDHTSALTGEARQVSHAKAVAFHFTLNDMGNILRKDIQLS